MRRPDQMGRSVTSFHDLRRIAAARKSGGDYDSHLQSGKLSGLAH
ncbi:hypothetical protein ACH492_37430 [Streptomyces sp. NPDC019443]